MSKNIASPNTDPAVASGSAPGRRRKTLARRIADAARIACSVPPPPVEANSSAPAVGSEVPSSVRERVLREYHAANLAKARRSAEELVRAGFNTGTVPYGYRPHRVRVSPPGRRARYRIRLRIEPVEASTVRTIFAWRVREHLSVTAITRRLARAHHPAPLDPDTGAPVLWTTAVVRAILGNPKYLGRQVWGRRHHGRWAPYSVWVWSSVWAHPPLVNPATFTAAQHPTRRLPDAAPVAGEDSTAVAA